MGGCEENPDPALQSFVTGYMSRLQGEERYTEHRPSLLFFFLSLFLPPIRNHFIIKSHSVGGDNIASSCETDFKDASCNSSSSTYTDYLDLLWHYLFGGPSPWSN